MTSFRLNHLSITYQYDIKKSFFVAKIVNYIKTSSKTPVKIL